MARLLLELGATSSQADSNGCTAFHRYVKNGSMELVDVLLDADKSGIKTAINHILIKGYYWTDISAPLHTAVEHGNVILVLKLLNAGALSQIDFDTWLKAAKVSPNHSSNLGNLEQSQKTFKNSLEQPLITAIRSADPTVALRLLENGADPNTLTSDTERLLVDEYRRRYTKGTSILDLVQKLIAKLSKYSGEETSTKKPPQALGRETYLNRFQPDTYSHWVVSQAVESSRKSDENQMKEYNKEQDELANMKGAPEKKEAIADAIRRLKTLEREIQNRGGKGFDELYPDIKTSENNYSAPYSTLVSDPKDFSYSFSFTGEDFMTETRRDGYVEL